MTELSITLRDSSGLFLPVDPVERFMSKLDRTGECWLWTAGLFDSGYAAFSPTSRGVVRGHRWSYRTFVGPIPDGLVVRHRCDVRRCVRPDHLELGTQAQNVQDRDQRLRTAVGARNGAHTRPHRVLRGEAHGRARLTEAIVRDLRQRYAAGESTPTLARATGLSRAAIYGAVSRRKWKHVA